MFACKRCGQEKVMFACKRCGQEKELTPEVRLLSAIFGEYICDECRNDEDERTRIMVDGIPLSDWLDSA